MDMMPIANKLQAMNLGEKGKTLFINFMPMECKDGILLRSPLNGTTIDFELPGYYKTTFNVIVRGHDYAIAAAKMQSVMTALCFFETPLEGVHYKYVRPKSLPVTFPVSEGNFYEIQVSFDANFVGESYGYAG